MTTQIPISLLRPFEAAARTCSFSAAAAEMSLTPGAISHAIRKLEQRLGVSLFQREGRVVHLTSDGKALMFHVGHAFDELRRGIETVSTHAPGLLRLHCAPSFAAQWLMPRLPRFLGENPGVEIRLDAGIDYMQFQSDEFDADIVYGLPQAEGFVILSLGEETFTPLCSPEVGRTIECPRDLLNQPLLEGYDRHMRWHLWFAENGLAAPPPTGSRFDRSFLALAAAVAGIGVALNSTRLAERELASGALVAPLAANAKNITCRDHYLVFPMIAKTRRPLRLFIAWLQRAIGITLDI